MKTHLSKDSIGTAAAIGCGLAVLIAGITFASDGGTDDTPRLTPISINAPATTSAADTSTTTTPAVTAPASTTATPATPTISDDGPAGDDGLGNDGAGDDAVDDQQSAVTPPNVTTAPTVPTTGPTPQAVVTTPTTVSGADDDLDDTESPGGDADDGVDD
jgi:hypothetical protein